MAWNAEKPRLPRGSRTVKVVLMGFTPKVGDEFVLQLEANGIQDAKTRVFVNSVPADAGDNEVIRVWKLNEPFEETNGDTVNLFQRAIRRAVSLSGEKSEAMKSRHILLSHKSTPEIPNLPDNNLDGFFLTFETIQPIMLECASRMRQNVFVH